MKKLIIIVFGALFLNLNAQDIQMDFPYLKGKSYDFIIFQGTNSKVVIQEVIPPDGKFTLSIPKEYTPYTGMSRWLITGTQEGGGLDMLIPGHDFTVTCKAAHPNDNNIFYSGNEEIPELNLLSRIQQEIFAKHDAMFQAVNAFQAKYKNYPLFKKEYQNQLKAYDIFQLKLKNKNNYPAKFINIVNITRGLGTRILHTEKEKAKNVADYITNQLDWDTLYTSGHWEGIINSWVAIDTQVFDDPKKFSAEFLEISKKIKDSTHYTDFATRVAYSLSQNGKDNFIAAIAPIVKESAKIKSFNGTLAAYVSVTEGSQSPDLVITQQSAGNLQNDTKTIKLSDYSKESSYSKTLLVFYDSGCGHCENILQKLSENYDKIITKGIRIISLSADRNEVIFKEKSKNFQWKDSYCDYKGLDGINFKNYAIVGTPTLILTDKDGKVILRAGEIEELLKLIK